MGHSVSGILFSVQVPKMNRTKRDTLVFENSLANVFITFQLLLEHIILYCAFCNCDEVIHLSSSIQNVFAMGFCQ